MMQETVGQANPTKFMAQPMGRIEVLAASGTAIVLGYFLPQYNLWFFAVAVLLLLNALLTYFMPFWTLWFTAITAALLSLVFAGLGHLFLFHDRGLFLFVLAILLYFFSPMWELAFYLNTMLFIFSAADSFSIGYRGFGIV
jgi:hypothetical protein